MPYAPQRGDAIWVDLNPQAGHEQAGRRPAIVLSPASYNNKVGMAIICPITNQAKGYSFEVTIPSGHAVTGVILADQVRNIDWQARNAQLICSLPPATVAEVIARLGRLL